MSKWVVDIKGAAGEVPFEISVLLNDNAHGKRSYGWFGREKILISHNGGPCRDAVPALVWGKLLTVADEVAEAMNAVHR